MQVNRKDAASGALFIAIGLAFGLWSFFNLRIGQAFNMGPGYFPIVLSLVLIGFGAVIIVNAVNKPSELFGAVPWRGVLLVVGAVFFFAATARRLGIAPSLAISIFLATLSTGRSSLVEALALSFGLTAFCVFVFIYALGLPYPVIGPWLGGPW